MSTLFNYILFRYAQEKTSLLNMALIETKAELTYDGILKSAASLYGHAKKCHLLRGFREFLKSVDDDYSKFRIAGVDVVRIHEAIALVQAGAQCMEVAKLVVHGALEAERGSSNKDILSLRDFITSEHHSGLHIRKEDFNELLRLGELMYDSLQSFEAGETTKTNYNHGKIVASNRQGEIIDLPNYIIDTITSSHVRMDTCGRS